MTRPCREIIHSLLVSASLQLCAAILAVCALDGGHAVQAVGAAMLLNIMLTIFVLRRQMETPSRGTGWALRYGFIAALVVVVGLRFLLSGAW